MSAGVVVSLCCQSKRSRDHRTLLPHTVVASNLSLQRSPPINTGLVGYQSRMEAPRSHASIFPVSSCMIELQLWQRECSVLVMNNTSPHGDTTRFGLPAGTESRRLSMFSALVCLIWRRSKLGSTRKSRGSRNRRHLSLSNHTAMVTDQGLCLSRRGEERRGEHNLSRAEVLGDLCSRHKMLPSLVLLFIRTSFPVCCDLLFCSRRSLLLSCFFSWCVGRERSTLNMAVRIETIAGGFGSTRTLTLQKPMRAHGSVHEPPLRCLTWNSEGGIHRNHDHRSSSSRPLLSVPRKYTAVDLFAWGTPAHCHCCSLSESSPSNALPLISSTPQNPSLHREHHRRRPMSWSRVADLETKLSKAQEELKKLRDQLGSAEVAKVDAEQALEKAKKQVFTVDRNSELDKRKSPPQESEPAPEPKPQTAPKSEVEDVSSPTASDVSKLVVPMEPLDQIKHEEEAEKEKDEQNMETIMQKDDDNNNGGGVEERNELVDLPESPEEVKLKYMILEKAKEVEFLLEENMSFKRRAEEEAENLAADARAKEEELKAKIGSMEEELKESRARAAHLMEQLAAAEGAKATLEVEMRRLRVQTGQWRKAAEAATGLLAAGDRAAAETGGRRVAERCRSMDGHHGGFDGWDSPLVGGVSEEDGVVGGRRKSAGIWTFGDLWKKRLPRR
ncbi:hypothetical protein GW17_00017079 [Ensete ventricosum]|nr:hypothetical protein GW17_00017079 [Ensete ventricosum]